mmetsp:Transcript_34013/g.86098  ORF Transcript_34013/g.86098 Transcript_34013/m.86098 type:complete len:231 (-) Transcript_34013:312-1004(-)
MNASSRSLGLGRRRIWPICTICSPPTSGLDMRMRHAPASPGPAVLSAAPVMLPSSPLTSTGWNAHAHPTCDTNSRCASGTPPAVSRSALTRQAAGPLHVSATSCSTSATSATLGPTSTSTEPDSTGSLHAARSSSTRVPAGSVGAPLSPPALGDAAGAASAAACASTNTTVKLGPPLSDCASRVTSWHTRDTWAAAPCCAVGMSTLVHTLPALLLLNPLLDLVRVTSFSS